MFVFFFKQKTAYELRISDWSSDVCSSDLRAEIVMFGGDDDPARIVAGAEPASRKLGQRRALRSCHFDDATGRGSCGYPGKQRPDIGCGDRPIGRAAGRERVCQYVLISVVDVSFTQKLILRKISTST